MKTKLLNCNICPRNCNANRANKNKGYCNTGKGYYIASIFPHQGEEPPISGENGICNVFFAHCNLQCVYCQNYQISNNKIDANKFEFSFEETIKKITNILDTGVEALGFVSPSHFVPQTIEIIKELKHRKYFPITVFNTNSYDKLETLQELEPYIDVYLPDLKYAFNDVSLKYSSAKNYPEIAFAAIKEMYKQKGSDLFINKNGYAESGLIIRHLVLPNNINNSVEILRFIASEISTDVHISVMSQYNPQFLQKATPELNRPLTIREYNIVLQEIEKLNFTNAFIQELESKNNYLPDFENEKPFE